jgi:MraZ protein
VIFTGEHEHTIDNKQRIAIPSAIRSRLDPERHGEGFYLVTGPNGVLWLWTEREFERIADQLERSLMPSEEALDFDEVTFPDATRVELDKVGRIRIPERMLARAGLGQNVLIIGMRDHLELRDPAEWEQTRNQREERRREIYLRARGAAQRERRDSLDREGPSGAGGGAGRDRS